MMAVNGEKFYKSNGIVSFPVKSIAYFLNLVKNTVFTTVRQITGRVVSRKQTTIIVLTDDTYFNE